MAQNMTLVQKSIIAQLTVKDKPMSMRQLANILDVTYQTIHNHMMDLLDQERVKLAHRDGNTNYYSLGDVNDALPRVKWGDGTITIHNKVRRVIEDNVLPRDPYQRRVLACFAEMYKLVHQAVQDDHPRPITSNQLKTLQASMSKTRETLLAVLQIYNDLLKNDALWSPNELPKELFIKDPDITLELCVDYYTQLSRMLNGRPSADIVENAED